MSDPRLTLDPAQGQARQGRRIIAPVADLCRTPGGPRDRQLLFGTPVTQVSEHSGWAYVQSGIDGYVGFVAATSLGAPSGATHRVSAAGTTLYVDADLKSKDLLRLSHGCRVEVTGMKGRFLETPDGFLPQQHACPKDQYDSDPASAAALYLGTPYLWGGNSRDGIDCSGLVQAALLACGIPCPGDSDMQQSLGTTADGSYQRNDLLFWKGHVAVVIDADTMIHANAHAMATTVEPIAAAIQRIEAQGDGPVTAHRRL